MKLTTQQIGKCGELLVQLKLLKSGIESSQMTTDSGIDLVAFSNKQNRAITIQVKSVLKPKPGGGKGRLSIDWRVPLKNKAEFIAFVNIDDSNVWFVPSEKLPELAQQITNTVYHFFMMMDSSAPDRKDGKPQKQYQFSEYLYENMAHKI